MLYLITLCTIQNERASEVTFHSSLRQLKQVIDWVVKYSHTENELNETECKYISENIGTDHVNINNDADTGLLTTQGLAG